MNSNCSYLLDLRNIQEQVKKAFCYQKLFWPFTVWINCSSDLKNFENSQPSASNFKSFSRSVEQFFLTVGQNNFGNKIPSFCVQVSVFWPLLVSDAEIRRLPAISDAQWVDAISVGASFFLTRDFTGHFFPFHIFDLINISWKYAVLKNTSSERISPLCRLQVSTLKIAKSAISWKMMLSAILQFPQLGPFPIPKYVWYMR